jgi:hypothetical protein
MAKKRKKSAPKRKRRMGAAGGFNIGEPLGTAAGAILGTYVINGPMQTTSYVNIGAIAVGLIIPRFSKSPVVQAVGNGLVAAGAVSIMQNANVISGMGRVIARRHSGRIMNGGPISSVAGMNSAQRRAQQITMNAGQGGRTVLNGVNVGNRGGMRRSPISSVSGFCDITS